MPINSTISKKQTCLEIESLAASIVKEQKKSGEIPWCKGNKTDPWDLVEAIMGLTIGGYIEQARQAFEWMAENQLQDGSWYSSYRNEKPEDRTKDANMTSYIAVGVLHHYLITQDILFLKRMWETILKAINFAILLQAPGGEIYWAKSPEGNVDKMSLLTGSSSIFMSLKSAIFIADKLGYNQPLWHDALIRLGVAIRNRPHIFNIAKSRYSMDWFYPVLCGAVTDKEAYNRIKRYWQKFVVQGFGVRCVADKPWITVAETCELILTLTAIENYNLGFILFSWIQDKIYNDGTYWCGFTFPDMTIWPEEKLTWTNAVAIMAIDSLYKLTSGHKLFSHSFWGG